MPSVAEEIRYKEEMAFIMGYKLAMRECASTKDPHEINQLSRAALSKWWHKKCGCSQRVEDGAQVPA